MGTDDGQNKPRTMTAEERRALVYAPFPIVRASVSKGNSQAPNWVMEATQRAEEGR